MFIIGIFFSESFFGLYKECRNRQQLYTMSGLMSVLGVEDIFRLNCLNKHDADNTLFFLEKTHSDFWLMKKSIVDVVALRNTIALETFVNSEKGQTFSCVYVICELYKLQRKEFSLCPAALQLAEAIESVCTILVHRDNILIQSDVEKYAPFHDIAIEIVESIQSLLHVPWFWKWNDMTQVQYTATFLHNRMEITRVVFTTELFDGLQKLCKRHKDSVTIAGHLLELVVNMTIQGDPATVKRLLSMPTHITGIQEFVQTTLSRQHSKHQDLVEIESNCVCFMQYLFRDRWACSVFEETQVCLGIIGFMQTKCVGYDTQCIYLELLLHRTKCGTLRELCENGSMDSLSPHILPRNSDIFKRICARCRNTYWHSDSDGI